MLLAAAAPVARAAGGSDEPLVRTIPTSATLGFESVKLPGNERMGLVGGSYLFELAPGWWLGPGVYGAATGQRGGLFTWGGEVERRWRMGESWGVVAGLYAGGGGGAAAPVGGGLMLRPHAGLMIDLGGWQAGLTASQVRFPSGQIRSTQLGVLMMVEDRFAFAPPGHGGEAVSYEGRGGIGADRMQLVGGRYFGRKDAAASLGFVGLRLEQQATPTLSATLEAAGAAQGGADGYMEALGGLSWQWPVGRTPLRVGARVAAGLAGGGAVKTGGGTMAKAALTAHWAITPSLSLDLEGGQAKALRGDFSAHFVEASLGMALADRPAAGGADRQTLHDMAWGIGVEHYSHALRKSGETAPMTLVMLQFERSLGEHLYLSGQAHSATTGGAGAYSVGLVGLGLKTRLGRASPVSVGAEALVGAAGGGGVASNGGAVAQPMAWIGVDLGSYSRLKLAGGKIRSRHGGLSTPVMEAIWSFDFSAP
jgi:hypothetical protein